MNVSLTISTVALAAAPVVQWQTDLQDGDGSLVPSGDPGQWEWGVIEMGPEDELHGPHGWATRLDTVHTNFADDRLNLPPVPLVDLERPILALTHWYELEPGDEDRGTLECNLAGVWTPMVPLGGPDAFEGVSEGWRTDYFALPSDQMLDLSDVRLRFQADEAVARSGWILGELALIDGDPVPPEVTITRAPDDTQDLVGPHEIEVEATDDVEESEVRLVWFTAADERSEVVLDETESGTFAGGLPGADPGTSYVWWVEAEDTAGNVGVATGPTFRVFLPAPTGLTAPAGRQVATTVPLTWTAPLSPWDVDTYLVYRNGMAVATSTLPYVDAPVSGADDVFTVTARFDTDRGRFSGDPSAPVAVEAYPPAILRVAPASAWPGDTLYVEIQGQYLLLESHRVSVDAGEGLHVQSVTVVDVDTALVDLEVDSDATPGERSLTVHASGLSITAEGAFSVRDDATRPQIEATDPTFLVRGAQHTLRVRTNVSLPEDPRLRMGPGIVVESGERRSEFMAEFTVTVARDAALEPRTPELDIGTRLLDGPPVNIRAPQPTTETTCGLRAAAPFAAPWWLFLLSAVMLRRRSPTRDPDGASE